jgi:hypothetical protein
MSLNFNGFGRLAQVRKNAGKWGASRVLTLVYKKVYVYLDAAAPK